MQYLGLVILFAEVALAWQPSLLWRNKLFEEADESAVKKPPVYSAYVLSGYLELPYAEIREQFTVYYDPKGKRSRVDYYDGLAKTIQRAGEPNTMYKIAYRSTEATLNQLTCFQVDGNDENRVEIQSGIPDLTSFSYIGTTEYNGRTADQWQFVDVVGSKKNTYTYIVDPVTGQPYRYEMIGYDSLFGSHFDKYYVEYKYFSPTTPNPEVFEPPIGLKCEGWERSGSKKTALSEHGVLMNPLSEYFGRSLKHHDEMFDRFTKEHGKAYSSHQEHAIRKSIYTQNVRFIHSTNRGGKTYRLAINHLADRTSDELRALRGFRRTSKSHNAETFNPVLHNLLGATTVPESMDWRLYGAVTPVKDQAVCGSCWTYGTTGTIEGTYFLKTGQLVRFSQQELVDCSWGEGNNGCDGGEDIQAYEFIKKHGITSEELYGPYIGQDGLCKVKNVSAVAHIKAYVKVPPSDEQALKEAIATNGPISVAIDASHKSFSFYSSGIYYEPKCGNGESSLDHAVLAVGYGKLMDGSSYWLIKNSWSTYWGNSGYILMSTKDNNCGVTSAATFVKIDTDFVNSSHLVASCLVNGKVNLATFSKAGDVLMRTRLNLETDVNLTLATGLPFNG